MGISILYVPKSSISYSSAITAYGLASFAERAFGSSDPILRQTPSHYIIEFREKLELPETIEDFHFDLPFLEVVKNAPATRGQICIKEETDKAKSNRGLPEEDRQAVHPKLGFYITVSSPLGRDRYNLILRTIIANKDLLKHHLLVLFQEFAKPDPDVAKLNALGKQAKLSWVFGQLTNPESPKGTSRKKADSTKREGNDADFWLLEVCKMLGLYEAASPVSLTSKRKFVYIADAEDISLSDLRAQAGSLNVSFLESPSSLVDSIAVLRVMRTLLDLKRQPFQTVSGLFRSEFESMGNVLQVFSNTYLHLPEWIESGRRLWLDSQLNFLEKNKRQASSNKGLIHEQDMYKLYRSFLVNQDIKALMDFLPFYTRVALSYGREKKDMYYLPTFRREDFEEALTLMEKSLLSVANNEGINNIARAIYNSAILGQWIKKKDPNYRYEIHYELLHELKQKSIDKSEFIKSILHFMNTYNGENARIQGRRRNLRNEDLQDFLREMEESEDEWPMVVSILLAKACLPADKNADPTSDVEQENLEDELDINDMELEAENV